MRRPSGATAAGTAAADGTATPAPLALTHVLASQATFARQPKVVVALRPRKLVKNVAATCLFLGAFTAAAYRGVVVQRFYLPVNDAAKNAQVDNRVELYNTLSGFLIALVETALGVYMNQFLPAFQVYLHNALWYLHGNATATRWTNGVRATLMFIFPVLLMLVIGQSLRSFQASQSSVGFTKIMARGDLARDVSLTELLKLNASRATQDDGKDLGLGVLQGAVNGTSLPFDLKHTSPCDIQRAGSKIGLHDLDSASVAYGFPPHEWYSEMLDEPLTATYTAAFNQAAVEAGKAIAMPDFDMDLAAELYGQSKVLLDRAVAESMTEYDACEPSEDADDDTGAETATLDSLVDDAEVFTGEEWILAGLRCDGSLRTLMDIGTFRALNRSEQTPAALLDLVSKSLAIAVDGLNRSSTRIEFRRHNVTAQIQMESMIVSAEIRIDNATADFFHGHSNVYEYGENAKSLCGETNCVFVDPQNRLPIPHQIVLVPQQRGCSYTQNDIVYRNDLRSFIPGNCSAVAHTGVAIAISSYITADRYGSNVTKSFPSRRSGTPFLLNPRRVLRLTMSRMVWETTPLDEQFQVDCHRERGTGDCTGLAYRLTKTGRFVFASEDAIPSAQIAHATLMEPIQLVQLNKARFYIPKWGRVMPERLYWQSNLIKKHNWKTSLYGENCSLFMDSYMSHVTRNGYVMDRPFQQLVRSTMFYLFAGGSVTELAPRSLVADAYQKQPTQPTQEAKALELDELLEAEALENVKLKGDIQYRLIRVVVPRSTYAATLIGCGVLLMVAVLIVIAPHARAMEYFPPGTTTAAQYIAVRNDETYPTPVNRKTLLFPATGHVVPLDDLDVEALVLVNKMNPTEEIKF